MPHITISRAAHDALLAHAQDTAPDALNMLLRGAVRNDDESVTIDVDNDVYKALQAFDPSDFSTAILTICSGQFGKA